MPRKKLENLLTSGAFLQTDKGFWVLGGPFESFSKQPIHFPCLYSPDFFLLNPKPWLKPTWSLFISKEEFISNLNEIRLTPQKPQFSWIEANYNNFSKSFNRIQALIQTHKLQKAVPITFEAANKALLPKEILFLLLSTLQNANNTFSYGYWDDGKGVLGTSPEVLFSLQEKKLTTMALAGTAKEKEGLKTAKEIKEHQFVIDGLLQKLSSLGQTTQGSTEIISLSDFFHLRTFMSVDLKNQANIDSLIHTLHPTAALGIFSETTPWTWLQELPEQSFRNKFGAPFGILTSENSFWCLVAIRNLQWTKMENQIFSGCGVINESHCEKEWAELKLKRNFTKKMLGLFSNDN